MTSTPKQKRFSSARTCGHCGNESQMEIVAALNDVKGFVDEEHGHMWDAGYVYELLRCPACKKILGERYYWESDDPGERSALETLFPVQPNVPSGMPEQIAKAYEAARRVRAIDTNAYGVLIGRLLDMICTDRKAAGGNLAARLDDLAARGEIPERLSKVASGLRKLRNVGAHADLGELTEQDVPLLDDLSTAILEYVYSAPTLVEQAEKRLQRLKPGKATGGQSSGVSKKS